MRISVDVGGTFTDFTVVRDSGETVLWKEDSRPDAPLEPIKEGLAAVADQVGLTLQEMLSSTDHFVHGSTIATNALIQKRGLPIGLLCTKGLRDVIALRDGYKPERFNIHLQRPHEFVDRHLRIGVEERIDASGAILVELNEADVVKAAERFRHAGVAAVAVAFLWSIVNDAHERRAAEILRQELPGVDVLCSADVLPEIREWERTSATVLSAFVLPSCGDYLRELERFLQDVGYERAPQIMQSNGGCASVDEVMQRPVSTIGSGPAAAPAAALHLAEEIGSTNLISIDMGGTSFDVCLIRGGRAAISRHVQVEDQPIGIPAVEVHSIGAGGGSIGWIDEGGALRVGPQSAGSRPGPACYGAGGDQPTVTDANVVLGYLSPTNFLGGRRLLREDLSHKAIEEKVANPLGLGVLDAAAGMVALVDANMVSGIRAVSVERGIDPRTYTLVSGGGAGGLHAARLAGRLGMRRVVIPRETSTYCAFGMTVTDVRHDYTRSHFAVSSDMDLSALDKPFVEMELEARARLRADGFDDENIILERSVDSRYQGQMHELTIRIPDGTNYTADHLEEITETFHLAHEERRGEPTDEVRELEALFHLAHEEQYTYSLRDVPVEFLHWRLTAIGITGDLPREMDQIAADLSKAAEDALAGERNAYFEEFGEKVPTRVYDAARLKVGTVIEGQAIIEAPTTTIVINPGDVLTVRRGGAFFIDVTVGPFGKPSSKS